MSGSSAHPGSHDVERMGLSAWQWHAGTAATGIDDSGSCCCGCVVHLARLAGKQVCRARGVRLLCCPLGDRFLVSRELSRREAAGRRTRAWWTPTCPS
jgi:hypothetical protein